jgi:transcriptional regulator with XRE-family HTH domain
MTLPGWRIELGAVIREARLASGLSQADLASELGVRQSSVSQWERGTTAPVTWHLLGLLMTFGAQLAQQLFRNEGGPELALFGRSREPCQSGLRASRGA